MNKFSKIFLTISLIASSQAFSMLRLARPISNNFRKINLMKLAKYSTQRKNDKKFKTFERNIVKNELSRKIRLSKNAYELAKPTSDFLNIVDQEIEEFAKQNIDDQVKTRSFMYEKYFLIKEVELIITKHKNDFNEMLFKMLMNKSAKIEGKLRRFDKDNDLTY